MTPYFKEQMGMNDDNESAARGVTIKTDATPYVHRRTGEVYLARHAGLMKIGHVGEREGWTDGVMYQKAEDPSRWFCRDLNAFCAQFVERRELAIETACKAQDVDLAQAPRLTLEKWSVTKGRVTGDLVKDGVVTHQDHTTERAQVLDVFEHFAIVDGVVYDLEGDEVVLG